jgi:hypothetical protein
MDALKAYQQGQQIVNQGIAGAIQMKQFAQEQQQQQELQSLVEQFSQNPSDINLLGRISALSPGTAQTLNKARENQQQDRARGVKSMYNTWKATSPSQRKYVYPALMDMAKKKGYNTEDFPLEYNEDTMQEIDAMFRFEDNNARELLGEKPEERFEYGKIPEGYILEKETGVAKRMRGIPKDLTTREKAPSGYRYTTEGNLEGIPGGPAFKMSATQAGKLSEFKSGLKDTQKFTLGLVDKKGIINRRMVNQLAVKVKLGEARRLDSLITNAIESKLRAETGLKATPSEVKSVKNRFMPKPLDNDKAIKEKLQRLEEYFSTAVDLAGGGRGSSQKQQELTYNPTTKELE